MYSSLIFFQHQICVFVLINLAGFSVYLKGIFNVKLFCIFTSNRLTNTTSNMKKLHAFTNAAFIGGSLFCFLFASCSKEIAVKQSSLSSTKNVSLSSKSAVSSQAVSSAVDPSGFLGVYLVRDSKTIFIGQANPKGTNEFIHLDYIDVPKTISAAADKKNLTMPYGPSNYVDSGWAYIIGYDAAAKTITLAPNAAMIADIVPGSFETRFVAYDPKSKAGTFVTRFTSLSDNGNETEISENFYKD